MLEIQVSTVLIKSSDNDLFSRTAVPVPGIYDPISNFKNLPVYKKRGRQDFWIHSMTADGRAWCITSSSGESKIGCLGTVNCSNAKEVSALQTCAVTKWIIRDATRGPDTETTDVTIEVYTPALALCDYMNVEAATEDAEVEVQEAYSSITKLIVAIYGTLGVACVIFALLGGRFRILVSKKSINKQKKL